MSGFNTGSREAQAGYTWLELAALSASLAGTITTEVSDWAALQDGRDLWRTCVHPHICLIVNNSIVHCALMLAQAQTIGMAQRGATARHLALARFWCASSCKPAF